jgi:signal transduction histidine kinase
MSATDAVVHDAARVAAVRATGLLDAAAEPAFDRLTRLAVRLLDVPTAFFSLVDDTRDFYVSACGFGEPLATARELTGPTFCQYAIQSREPLVIPDTAADPRYRDVPTVRTLGVAAYMGVPLAIDGQVIGSFCVIDTVPRPWTASELEILVELAASAEREIGLRAAVHRSALLVVTLREQATELAEQQAELEAQQAELEERYTELSEQKTEIEQQSETLQEQALALERANAALLETNEALERAALAADEARAAADVARGEADEANRAKSQFLASMSHELRTPLNAILGYRQLLEDEIRGPLTEGQRSYLARLGRAQAHLLTLINDVLQFAKIEAGEARLVVADVLVRDVCSRLEELVGPQLEAKRIRYGCELPAVAPAGTPLLVRADADRLVQILVNLVTNALKFTAPSGAVRLRVDASDSRVRFHVSDTGTGIAPEKLQSIFDPFVQVARPRSSREGVGLGLAIARELAQKMGGDVTVESELGVGSTFTLELPGA